MVPNNLQKVFSLRHIKVVKAFSLLTTSTAIIYCIFKAFSILLQLSQFYCMTHNFLAHIPVLCVFLGPLN